jgi:hypothetical protein
MVALMAYNLALAEKIQNGQMTFAEGNAAFEARKSQAVTEALRRMDSATMAAAADEAATASIMQATRPQISQPMTCTHFPGSVTTTCN